MWALAACGVGAVALLVLGLLVHRHPENHLDIWALNRRSFNGRLLGWANEALDLAGSRVAMPLLVVVVARMAWWRWRSVAITAVPVVAPAAAWFLAEHVLKHVFTRPMNALEAANSWPSGTMAAVTALAVSIVLLLQAQRRRYHVRDGLGVLVVLAGLTWCFVLTGYHTPTDMAGGVLLGVISAVVCASVVDLLLGRTAIQK